MVTASVLRVKKDSSPLLMLNGELKLHKRHFSIAPIPKIGAISAGLMRPISQEPRKVRSELFESTGSDIVPTVFTTRKRKTMMRFEKDITSGPQLAGDFSQNLSFTKSRQIPTAK